MPLISLGGWGRAPLALALYHRSNPSGGDPLEDYNGHVGRGWSHSGRAMVFGGSQPLESIGANTTSRWLGQGSDAFGLPTSYLRRPGVRADLTSMKSGGTITGYTVLDQESRVKRVYQQRTVNFGPLFDTFYLSYEEDLRGNRITYTYEFTQGEAKLRRITDSSNAGYERTIEFAYVNEASISSQVSWVELRTDDGNRRWQFVYGPSPWGATNCLKEIRFPPIVAGTTIYPTLRFEYTGDINIADFYDFKGNRWHYEYGWPYLGSRLDVVAVYQPHPTAVGSYDATAPTQFTTADTGGYPGEMTCSITDQLGALWKHEYYNGAPNGDPQGADFQWLPFPIKRVIEPLVTHASGGTSTYAEEYEWNFSWGTIKRHTDRKGNITEFTYEVGKENRGWLDRRREFTGASTYIETTFDWHATLDRVIRTIDPMGMRTLSVYNSTFDELASVEVDPKTDIGGYSNPAGIALKTNYSYGSRGQLIQQWTGTDNPTNFSHTDPYGNVTLVTRPSGATVTTAFDAWGNKLTETELAPGGTSSFEYDNWNRLTRAIHPDAKFVETTYDANSNAVTTKNENGFVSTLEYDGLNRLVKTTRPVDAVAGNNIVNEFAYDPRSDRTGIKNGNGQWATYFFDARRMPWKVQYPDSTTRISEYDGNGNRRKGWNGRNQLTQFTYDTLDRLTNVNYTDASTPDVTFTYRNDGLRATMADGSGTSTYTYNSGKQLISHFQALANKTVTYTYDGAGRKASTQVGSQTWNFDFDGTARLYRVRQSLGEATPAQFTFWSNDAVKTRQSGTNFKTYFDYDNRGRTTAITHKFIAAGGAESQVQKFSYQYDFVGNVTQYRDDYERLDTLGDVEVGAWTTNFTYDRADRLKTEVRSSSPQTGSSYNYAFTYDKNGNRTQVVRGGITYPYSYSSFDKLASAEGWSLSNYDADGNPRAMTVPGSGSWTLTYNEANRLRQLVMPSATKTYKYDGDGRRIEKAQGGTIIRYVYDGSTLIAEVNGSGTITSYHLPGVGFYDTGQRMYQENGIGSNVTVRANGAQYASSIYEYDAWGTPTTIHAGLQSVHRFAGKHGYVTDESKLQLLGARYYIPQLGRFMTQDPIGQAGGINLYEYCGNRPLNVVDPEGLQGNELDRLQAKLDIAGLFDPTGISDFYGAWLSFERGDLTGGFLSLGSLIPLGGDAAAKPAKFARQAAKTYRSQKAFRKMVMEASGLSREAQKLYQAHHLIPFAALDLARRRFGNDIDEVFYSTLNGMPWHKDTHQKMWSAYDKAIKQWLIDAPSNATVGQLISYARKTANQMGAGVRKQ